MNYNLQGLRAFAALAVLAFHAGEFYIANGGELGFMRGIFAAGHTGVDLFFVLSGFIIARSVDQWPLQLPPARRFIERRLLRIYLGYWPIAAVALAYYATTVPARVASVDPWASALLLSARIDRLLIGPSWSLAHELFFYASFGLLAMATRKTAFTLVGLYLAVILVANLIDPMNAAHFLLSPHLLELFAGMFLGQARLGLARINKLRILSLVAVGVVVVWYGVASAYPLPKVIAVGAASLLAVYIADRAAALGHNPRGWFSRVGDASYGLYLMHYLLLEVFHYQVAPMFGTSSLRLVAFWCWVLGIVVLSLVHYRWVERPLYRWGCQQRGLGSAPALT
ncbi:MAG: acyltransferase [Betaproteobacteria bacterium]|nr:acyltransferase [Betaproteobacteria bacterium]